MSLITKLRERRMMHQAERGPYPIHGRTLGYLGTPREPYTWFVCNNGHIGMGSPWEEPDSPCPLCGFKSLGIDPFLGWEVADPKRAREATMEAIDETERPLELYARTQE